MAEVLLGFALCLTAARMCLLRTHPLHSIAEGQSFLCRLRGQLLSDYGAIFLFDGCRETSRGVARKLGRLSSKDDTPLWSM